MAAIIYQPAHDLVRQKNSTHLWVLVLALKYYHLNIPNVFIIIIIILYPRVYNARGLKTERIKTAKMTRSPECHQ